MVRRRKGAAAQEWQFEVEVECKDDVVGARSTQALARRLVSASSPGDAFQRQHGEKFALDQQRTIDQGQCFAKLA
jgi:hypothetical protein